MRPILDDVAAKVHPEDYALERTDTTSARGNNGPLLQVALEEHSAFHYQVFLFEAPVPTLSG